MIDWMKHFWKKLWFNPLRGSYVSNEWLLEYNKGWKDSYIVKEVR